jgi:hypothetical protein
MMRLMQVSAAGIVLSDPSIVNRQSSIVISPNPFRGLAGISYSLAAKSRVALRIYDPAGREVKTLFSREQNAGKYMAVWDGTDNLGRLAPSGVYFCRMEVQDNDFRATRKLLLLPVSSRER